jgi:DNA-binding response OmpR family regulator
MAGEKILIVDDDQGLLILMRVRLEAAGYQVIQAEGGQEALLRVQETACDLALVDLKMVDMDGITLLRSCSACILDSRSSSSRRMGLLPVR